MKCSTKQLLGCPRAGSLLLMPLRLAHPSPCCSNPMAGQDSTLLALAGSGFSGGHSFGFASCERVVGAAEGINVLVKRRLAAAVEPSGGSSSSNGSNGTRGNGSGHARYEYVVTNVEYTEFERLGFADQQAAEGSNLSKFPANTNVLYVGLEVRGPQGWSLAQCAPLINFSSASALVAVE